MATSKHKLAQMLRDKKLRRVQEVYAACACEFPLVAYRNGHGHGKTPEGTPCPAIEVIRRHDDEDAEAAALLGRRR